MKTDPTDIRPESDRRGGGFTITPEWKLPLYVVVPIICLASVITKGYVTLNSKLDAMVSRSEIHEYMQILHEKNPTLVIPTFPLAPNEPVGAKTIELVSKEPNANSQVH